MQAATHGVSFHTDADQVVRAKQLERFGFAE
jgi:hypothetical protein